MSELLEEVRGPLAGCRADKEVWDEIKRLEAKVEKLESIISRAHAEIRFELRLSEQEVNDLDK